MASAKTEHRVTPVTADQPARASAVFEACASIYADGKRFAPGDCVDVCAATLAQLLAAGAVKEL